MRRDRVYAALFGRGDAKGLTITQVVSVVLILISVGVAILGTEPVVVAAAGPLLRNLEIGFVAAFTTEYLMRLWAVGANPVYSGFWGRLRYAVSFYALIDLLAILPFLFGLGAQSLLVRLLRLFRLLALSRLIRYSQAMRVVLGAVIERRYELTFSMALSGCVILLSSGVLYSVEAESNPEAFGSIPRAIWWAVTTLTTVGYGDAVPITVPGKFFAAITAIAGIGLIAMPTGILAAAFSQGFRDVRNTEASRK
ncbi:ion transporter [Lysobacter sp. Root983]|uniref:ion transporter n=1 Tax=Lysobacter sp. Root983 TaxID=1736613 RepID=UPI000AA324AE|nr:ion transporter [Lysobacter sp. Root983]